MASTEHAPELLQHFMGLTDLRVERTKLHSLEDIVCLTIMAVICGADGWTEVEQYGKAKEQWLSTILQLPNGIPSHDTIGNVMRNINPDEFERSFINWTLSVCNLSKAEVVSIDGKTLRRSHDKGSGKGAIHMVSAWADQNQMVLGQLKIGDKSNEITAIPKLLNALVLKGCIITIDAMGCQKDIAQKIIDKEAHYILALKSNQGKFSDQVQQQFALLAAQQVDEHLDAGHGRIETRTCSVISDLKNIEQAGLWKGLRTIVMIGSVREMGDRKQTESRYYISSLPADAKLINYAVRAHWGVENNVHWTLDVAFSEDQCRIRDKYGAENFSRVRRIALNLLKNESSLNKGIKTKRMKAGWDNQYLQKIIEN